MMSESTATAPKAALPPPAALILLGLAVAAFGVIAGATWAAGFGRDIHLLRVCITLVVLVAVALSLRRLKSPAARVAAVGSALLLGGIAWWQTPARPGGLSLNAAAAKREAILHKLGPVTFNDVVNAEQWRNSIEDLAREYPSLAEGLRPEFAAWGADAAAAVMEQLRDSPPDDPATALAAYARGREVRAVFPEYGPRIDDAYRGWIRQAIGTHLDLLEALPLGDWDAFEKTSAARVRHAASFSESREQLAAGEKRWVERSAGAATEPALRALEANPAEARAACRNVESRLRKLPGISDGSARFGETRAALFRVAHDAVTREVHTWLRAKRYDRAFDVALQHGFEWAAAARLLNADADAAKALAELREHARHLAVRFERAGVVDRAPEPRGRESAPPPRARAEASILFPIGLLLLAPGEIRGQSTDAASEQRQLEEALEHIHEQRYIFAVAKLGPLVKSTALPVDTAKAIPGLIDDLRALDAVVQLAAVASSEKLPATSAEHLPASVKRPLGWLELLRAARELLETRVPVGTKLPWGVAQADRLLATVGTDFDADSASRLRVEFSARLFLLGRPQEATQLLQGEPPSEHARQVLEDLRTTIVGDGTLSNPQVARFVPEQGLAEMPGAQSLVPLALRDKWKRPQPPAEAETTIEKLETRARTDLIRHAGQEQKRLVKQVDETTGAIRKRLGK